MKKRKSFLIFLFILKFFCFLDNILVNKKNTIFSVNQQIGGVEES